MPRMVEVARAFCWLENDAADALFQAVLLDALQQPAADAMTAVLAADDQFGYEAEFRRRFFQPRDGHAACANAGDGPLDLASGIFGRRRGFLPACVFAERFQFFERQLAEQGELKLVVWIMLHELRLIAREYELKDWCVSNSADCIKL